MIPPITCLSQQKLCFQFPHISVVRVAMGFHLLALLAFLALMTLAASYELTPQVYWNSVLTNTPMPNSIAKLVPNEVVPASAFYRHEAYDPNPFDDDDRFYWLEEETADKLLEDPTQDLFYLESDLHPGTTMKYSLARREKSVATFLPRKTAESIPFSSAKLPEMLNQFSVKPGSLEARTMQQTVDSCESTLLQKGEDRKCATSLESMIDLATSKLGSRDIRAIPTEVGEGAVRLQNYTIVPGMKKLADAGKDKVVLCHKRTYGYAVFYCHNFGTKVRAYEVPLLGSDGTKAKAVAICHTDTSHWQPKSFPLQVLNIKPGTVPVCHFIPEGDIAWVPNPKLT